MAKHRPSVVELQEVLWDMPRVYSDEELELFLNCETAKIIDTEAEASEDSADSKDLEDAVSKAGAELEQKVTDLEAQLEAQAKVSEDLDKQVTAAKQAMDNHAKETKAATDELVQNCNDATELLKASEARDGVINPVLGQVAKLAAVLTDEEKEKLPEDIKVAVELLLELNQKVEDLNTDPA